MCTRGSNRALLGGPSTSPLDGMAAVPSAQQLRRRDLAVLCVAWAPVLWAGFSICLFIYDPVRIPDTIGMLAVLSGVICIVGGLVSIVYLLAVAETRRSVLSGVCAITCNFGYVWWWYSYFLPHLDL